LYLSFLHIIFISQDPEFGKEYLSFLLSCFKDGAFTVYALYVRLCFHPDTLLICPCSFCCLRPGFPWEFPFDSYLHSWVEVVGDSRRSFVCQQMAGVEFALAPVGIYVPHAAERTEFPWVGLFVPLDRGVVLRGRYAQAVGYNPCVLPVSSPAPDALKGASSFLFVPGAAGLSPVVTAWTPSGFAPYRTHARR
jgi:hypothetical protein